MKPIVIQSSEVWPGLGDALHARFTVLRIFPECSLSAVAAEHGRTAEVMISTSKHGLTVEMLDAFPNLQMISNFGVGLDGLHLSLLRERGIQLGFTPDVLTDCVADHAMALAMAACRQIAQADRFVRESRWLEQAFPLGLRFSGKRLGIVGLGRIGQAVAQRAEGFGMCIGFVGGHLPNDTNYQQFSNVSALAEWSDILIVTVSGDSRNRNLIDAGVLERLGRDGVLINVSRGMVVDEMALIQALKRGTIAAAGLDVFVNEPQVSAALIEMNNIVLTPHIASSTQETRQAMADLVIQNLEAYFEGKPLVAAAF